MFHGLKTKPKVPIEKKVWTMRKRLSQRLQAASAALALVTVSATAGGPPSASPFALAPTGKNTASSTAFAGPLDGERSFNRLIIKFKAPATTPAGVFDFRAAQGKVTMLATSAKKRNPGSVGLRQLKSVSTQTQVALTDHAMTRAELFALAKQLEHDPSVDYAEIDEVMYPQFVPNDPAYAAFQWHYKAPSDAVGGANLPLAWDRSKGAGVVVAVIDTGYRPHADLASNILPGYDFVSTTTPPITGNDGDGWDSDALDTGNWTVANQCYGGSFPSNSNWHGTHVAGTIAALANNGIGGAGIAFEAKILPVRVLGTCGGWTSDIAAGMRWAAGLAVPGAPPNPNKAKVLNLSLGGSGVCGVTTQIAVNDVRAAGSAVVVATGNDGNYATISTPANCTGVIAVTAHTQSGDHASYGNAGAGTTISGPGGGAGVNMAVPNAAVYSTLNAGTTVPGADSYAGYQGTSMATPHVAGVAALLASLQPNITPDEIASDLTNSARPHPVGTYCATRPGVCGAGLLDAAMSLGRLSTLAPTVVASAGAAVQLTGATITLNGQETVKPGGKAIISRLWVQTTGPAVTLSSTNTATTTFVAPSTGASYTFRYMVTDGDGLVASGWASVQSNTAPVLNAIASQSVVAGQNLNFTATATDIESNAVAFVGTGLPSGATLNAATGVFTWNAASPVGNYSVSITPNDGFFDGAPQTVAIAVASAPAVTGGGGGGALNVWDLLALLALLAVSWGAARRRTPQ